MNNKIKCFSYFLLKICFYFISIYQFFSRVTPACCRYYPTCSQYMRIALEKHGLIRGLLLGFTRIIRCSSFFCGGVDKVPSCVKVKRIIWSYREFWNTGRMRMRRKNYVIHKIEGE